MSELRKHLSGAILLVALAVLTPSSEAAISLTLDGSPEISSCDTVVLTNTLNNTGGVLSELWVTNQIPAPPYAYVTNSATITLPDASQLTGEAAEPTRIDNGTNLVWDLSSVTSGSSIDHLLITEVYYNHPGTSDDAHQWLEIYNPTLSSISLDGYSIEDAIPGRSDDLLTTDSIPAGGLWIIAANTNTFYSDHPGYTGVVVGITTNIDGTLGSGLNDYADGIFLVNGSGTKVDGMSYGSASTAFDPPMSVVSEGYSAERDPINEDSDEASDWSSQSTPNPGTGTLATGIAGGSSIVITYSVEAGCGAVSAGFTAKAAFEQPPGSAAQSDTSAHDVTLYPADLLITKSPLLQTARLGEEVEWTIDIYNAGLGNADHVRVVDNLGEGLQFIDFDVAPTNGGDIGTLSQVAWDETVIPELAVLDPGELVSIVVTAKLTACDGLVNNADATFGCQGMLAASNESCEDTASNGGTAGGSVEFIFSYAELSGSISPAGNIPISYCGGDDITLYLTNAPGATVGKAVGIEMVPSLPTGWTLSGDAVDGASGNIVIGDLAAGEATNVTVTLVPGGSCPLNLDQQSFTLFADFEDPCGVPYSGPSFIKYAYVTNEPSASITKVMASSVSGQDLELPVEVHFTYENFDSTEVTFIDDYPEDPLWSASQVSDGGSVSSTAIVWTATLSGSGVYTTSFKMVWADTCDVPDGTLINRVYADDYVDCQGCTREVSGDGQGFTTRVVPFDCPDPGEEGAAACAFSSSKSSPPALVEVCDFITLTQTVYNIHGTNVSSSWAGSSFVSDLADGHGVLTSENDISVLIDASDVTAYISVDQTDPSLDLDFSGLDSHPTYNDPGSITGTISIVWSQYVTEPGQHFDRSTFTLSSCDSESRTVGWNAGESRLDVSLDALELYEACGIDSGVIRLSELESPGLPSGSNDTFPSYDVRVMLDMGGAGSSYSYISGSTTFSNMYDLSGDPVTAVEPVNTGTTLVWNVGDLEAGGAGEIHYQLRAGCDINTGEQHQATVYYNNACTDGTSPESNTNTSNTLDFPDSLFSPTLSAFLEPETSYLSGTQMVLRLEVKNTGSGTAYNLQPHFTMPANITYNTADLIPDGITTTSLTWNLQSATTGGDLEDKDGDGYADDLPPNGLLQIYLTANIDSCADTNFSFRASSGCFSDTCEITTEDYGSFAKLTPSLTSATTFPDSGTLCETNTVNVRIRNSGQATDYDISTSQQIPEGMEYVSGTAAASVNGGATSSISDPTGAGTEASPLVFSQSQVSALSALSPDEYVDIYYDVHLTCASAFSDPTFVSQATYYDLCGDEHLSPRDENGTIDFNKPVLTLTKKSRNVTLGQSSFSSSTVPGNPGDVIAYQIIIAHSGSSEADAHYLELEDDLPPTITFTGASLAPDDNGGGGPGAVLTWSNSTLMAQVGGSPYETTDGSITILVTGIVTECASSALNTATLNYGCDSSCFTLSATASARHTFTPSVTTPDGGGDGLTLTPCGGTHIVSVGNYGGSATNLLVEETAPEGYIITGASISGELDSANLILALSGSPNGRVANIDLSTATASGATDDSDDANDGSEKLDLGYDDHITIVFTYASDGSTLDCAADPTDFDYADPDPAGVSQKTASTEFSFEDMCGNSYDESTSDSTIPVDPDVDINVTPNSVIVGDGDLVDFDVTIENFGEQGDAENLHMRVAFGSGWTDVTYTGADKVESGSGSITTEQQGNSNVLVSLSGVVLDPIDDYVTLHFQAEAMEGDGELYVRGEVVGECTESGIISCTPTNTLAEAPYADTWDGSTIHAVNGNYYAFDQDESRAAGFSFTKTVRLDEESAPGGDSVSGRIGEELIFRIQGHYFGNTFENVLVTDSLPSNLEYGTPVDVGSSAGISGNWTWDAGAGEFTLPDINDAQIFLVEIPATVLNSAENQGDVGANTIFTNVAISTFDADGVTNATDPDTTVMTLLEPDLSVTKSANDAAIVQAGDIIYFTNTIAHTASSSTNAYDISFTDTLPDGMTFTGMDLSSDGRDNDGDGSTDEADEATLVSGDSITVDKTHNSQLADLNTAGSVTIIFPVEILNQTLGGVMTNESSITWTSLEPASENDQERDGSGGVNEYSDSSSVEITSEAITTISKTLEWTSQTNSVDPQVVIGERMVYRVHVEVPQGVTENAVITDLVPPGMDFVGLNPAVGLWYPGQGYGFEIPAGGPVFPTNAAQGLVVTDTDYDPDDSTDNGGSGDDIVFNIGTITNTPDGNADNDYFDLMMEYVILDESVNDGITSGIYTNHNAVNYSDNLHDITVDGPDYSIADFLPRLTKQFNETVVDAGDTVEVTLTAYNNTRGLAYGYDAIITDFLSSDHYDVGSLEVLQLPAGWSFSTNVVTGGMDITVTTDEGTPLTYDDAVTIFSIDIAQAITPGLVFTNSANLKADSIDGEQPTNIRDQDRSNNHKKDTLSVPGFSATKSLQATSETDTADSSGSNVQIGEVLTYAIEITLPETTVPGLTISDSLPAGLAYVHGSAASDTTSFNGTLGTLTVDPAGSAGTLAGNGTDITFTYTGDTVVTGDDNTENNSFTLTFDAVVLDVPGNTGLSGNQETHVNSATVNFTDNPGSAVSAGSVQTTVIEPHLSISKAIDETSVDAGDTVNMTLVVTNSGLGTAYDVRISDALDPTYYDTATVTADTVPSGYSFNVSNDVVWITADNAGASQPNNTLPASGSLTIEFHVTMADTLPPNFTHVNTASIAAADTIQGDDLYDEERDASGDSDTDSISGLDLDITKSLYATSETGTSDSTGADVQLGEVVTFELKIDLPEGTMDDLVVSDAIPDGLAYVYGSATLDKTTDGFNGSNQEFTPSLTGSGLASSGADLSFAFGDVVTSSDNDSGNDSFRIRYQCSVVDVAGNVGLSGSQTELENQASITFTGNSAAPVHDGPVTLDVVEPNLLITKTMDPTSGDAGDTVTVYLTATNTGLATGYDLVFEDTLNTNAFDPTSVAPVTVPAGFTMSRVGNLVSFSSDGSSAPPANSIEPNEGINFAFSMDIAADVKPNLLLTNVAVVAEADTIYGSDPYGEQRDASGAEEEAIFLVGDIVFSKSLVSTSEAGDGDSTGSNVQIGETVTYRLSITLPESEVEDLEVTDLIPAGLSYVRGSASVDSSNFAGTLGTASFSPTGTGLEPEGNDLTISFAGTTASLADNNAANDVILIDLDAVVLDVGSNVGTPGNQTIIANSAEVTFADNPGDPVSSGSLNVTVVEPVVEITKNIVQTSADAGDTVTMQLTLTNSGPATAYDLEVTDVLDTTAFDETTFSATTVPDGFTLTHSGATITLASNPLSSPTNSSLESGEGLLFEFTVAMASSVAPNLTVTNTAVVTAADTIDDEDTYGEQRDESGAEDDDTMIAGNFLLSKTLQNTSESGSADSTGSNLQIGEVATFEIEAILPEGTITDLVISDAIPDGMAYVLGSAAVDTSAFGGSIPAVVIEPTGSGLATEGQDVSFTFTGTTTVTDNNNASDDVVTITLQAVALDVGDNTGLSGNQTTLTNIAEVTYTGNPGDPVPSAPLTLPVVEPNLVLSKSFSPDSGDAGDEITVTLELENTGLGTAYDVALTDVIEGDDFDISSIAADSIPAGWSFSASGTPDRTVTISSSGGTQSDRSVSPGETLTFTFTMDMAQTVQPGSTLTNTATVTAADSIDGTADHSNERDDTGAQDDASATVDGLTISKSLLTTSETGDADTTGANLAIGETATFRLAVTLPETTIEDLVIVDVLPDGLQYVPGSVSVDTATPGFAGSLPGAPSVSGGTANGEDITFSFTGTTTVTGDNNEATDTFYIDLICTALDVTANEGLPASVDGDGQTTLSNYATADCNNYSGQATSDNITVTIAEPALFIDKRMSTPTNNVVWIDLVLTNKGTATSYDLHLSDVFPAQWWDTTTITPQVMPAGFDYSTSGAPGDATLSIYSKSSSTPPANSIEAGEGVTFSFKATLLEGMADQEVTNTCFVLTNTTINGTSTAERDEPDVQDTATFALPDLVATKKGIDTTGLPLSPGDEILYTIVVRNNGDAAATGVHVYDIVPTNTTLVSGSITSRSTQQEDMNPIDLLVGTLNPGASATVTFRTTVNTNLDPAITSIWNRATATLNELTDITVADNNTAGHDKTADDGVDDGDDTDSYTYNDDPTILSLGRVEFALTKNRIEPSSGAADLGEAIVFSIMVSNTGNRVLTSVPLEDRYDNTELEFFAAWPAPDDSTDDGVLNWGDLGTLNPGEINAVTVSFTAVSATVGEELNVAVASPTAENNYPTPDPKTNDAPYQIGSSTLALLSGFSVAYTPEGALIEWSTASEIGTAAFELTRLKGDTWTPVGEGFFPSLRGAPQGGVYQVLDQAPQAGDTVTYHLVEYEATGTKRILGTWTHTLTKKEAVKASSALLSEGFTANAHSTRRPRYLLDSTPAPSTGDFIRLPISTEGIYYLEANTVSEMLALPLETVESMILNGTLELRNCGRRCVYLPASSGAGLYFYGQRDAEFNVPNNIYWLGWGRNPRLPAVDGTASLSAPMGISDATIHLEENLEAKTFLAENATSDFWVGQRLLGGRTGKDTATLTMTTLNPACSEDALLTISMRGGFSTDNAYDHSVDVRFNQQPVCSEQWSGTQRKVLQIGLSAGQVIEGDNSLTIQAFPPPQGGFGIVYMDYAELSYSRELLAHDNILFFDVTEPAPLRIDGFTDVGIVLLDISKPRTPRLVAGTLIEPSSNGYALSFTPPTAPGRYAAFLPEATASVTQPCGTMATDLTWPGHEVDLLMITVDALTNSLERLAAHRRSDGLSTLVVTYDDVCDAFGHGRHHPTVLKDFLAYAWQYWTRAPRYVLLAGNGTYDPLNHAGASDNLVPPGLVHTVDGVFSSDTILGDVTGDDGLPEMAIGRIPATTPAQLDHAIDKILAYEDCVASGQVLLMADDTDIGGDFSANITAVASNLPPEITPISVILDPGQLESERTQVLNTLNTGCSLTVFYGHGGLDRLTQEGLFTSADISSLTNSTCPTVLSAMTCVIGRFGVPGYDALAEQMLLSGESGAAAVWSPTGLSMNDFAGPLGQNFVKAMFKSENSRLGDAVLEAMNSLVSNAKHEYLLNIYNLLGDPAMKIAP